MRTLEVNAAVKIAIDEIEFTFVRSSGPGGQNVNKVSSKAVLRWNATTSRSVPDDVRPRLIARLGKKLTATGDVVLQSQRFRDQGRNTADCLEKLRELLATALARPKTRRATKPSRASVERRIKSKEVTSQKKRQRRTPVDD